jgi:hypothetical protein
LNLALAESLITVRTQPNMGGAGRPNHADAALLDPGRLDDDGARAGDSMRRLGHDVAARAVGAGVTDQPDGDRTHEDCDSSADAAGGRVGAHPGRWGD